MSANGVAGNIRPHLRADWRAAAEAPISVHQIPPDHVAQFGWTSGALSRNLSKTISLTCQDEQLQLSMLQLTEAAAHTAARVLGSVLGSVILEINCIVSKYI
jgi:hypothetical protein